MQTRDSNPIEEKKEPPIKEEIPSIVGKSKFNPGHRRTKAATDSENEKAIEKVSTFVPPTDSDPQIKDVEVPLEKVGNLLEEEFDEEAEQEELEIGRDAFQASGVSFDELITTGKVIHKDKPSDEEKDTAGQILYENQSTEMIDQVTAKDEATLNKVNALIHHHMKKYNLHTEETLTSDSEDFENFNVEQLF